MRLSPSQSYVVAIAAALASIEKELAKADNVLAPDTHLAGADFSLADIQLGNCFFRYYDVDGARAEWSHPQFYHSRLQT